MKSQKTNKNKQSDFDFDTLPAIMGIGIRVIERELIKLSKISEEKGLADNEAKLLISYQTTLREMNKDYRAEVELVKKELQALSTEELKAMAEGK